MKELIEMDDVDLTKITHFPFQTQINYTGLDGAKYCRVITQVQKVSNERASHYSNANHEIMMQNCMQTSATMARHGDYRGAQCHAKAWGKAMKNNIGTSEQFENYENYRSAQTGAYHMMRNQTYVQRAAGPSVIKDKKDIVKQDDEFVYQMAIGKGYAKGKGCNNNKK